VFCFQAPPVDSDGLNRVRTIFINFEEIFSRGTQTLGVINSRPHPPRALLSIPALSNMVLSLTRTDIRWNYLLTLPGTLIARLRGWVSMSARRW
jgi:hypothetical protein